MIVSIEHALDRQQFGGKAAQLAQALSGGLPVPSGLALSADAARRVASGSEALPGLPEGEWAVRSSAADEDGTQASFAGQHLTVLHTRTSALAKAVAAVVASATSAAARAYRARMGAPSEARMGVVVQRMVPARAAGVMFTKNPVTGADECVIEAAWGLGEAVVAGLVVPDGWRVARDGRVLHQRLGIKDREVVSDGRGGTAEVEVTGERARQPCLSGRALSRLVELAERLDSVFTGPHDAEFAFDADDRLFLLQRRSVTR